MFWKEIWKISEVFIKKIPFLVVKFSIYLNRRVSVMVYNAPYNHHCIDKLPELDYNSFVRAKKTIYNIGIKHGFSCINIRHILFEVLKTEAEGRGFQHLQRDLANVNALKNHVRSLLLHKNWKHLLHFALFLGLFCFAFSPMSRERYFHGLCLFEGTVVHILWRQQFCGPGTSILKVA